MPTEPEAITTDAIERMSAAQFVSFFAGLTFEQAEAWRSKLFAGKRADDPALSAKARALVDHRLAEIRRDKPEWFY
jgi:hypothetical protein